MSENKIEAINVSVGERFVRDWLNYRIKTSYVFVDDIRDKSIIQILSKAFEGAYGTTSYLKELDRYVYSFTSDTHSWINNVSDETLIDIIKVMAITNCEVYNIHNNEKLTKGPFFNEKDLDEWEKSKSDINHKYHPLSNRVHLRIEGQKEIAKNNNSQVYMGKHPFGKEGFVTLFEEVKKRKIKEFPASPVNSSFGFHFKGLMHDYYGTQIIFNALKLKKEDIEDIIVSKAMMVVKAAVGRIGIAKEEKRLTSGFLDSNISVIANELTGVWHVALKNKSDVLVEFVSENVQMFKNIAKDYDGNARLRQAPLDLLNGTIYKKYKKVGFAKDYYYVKEMLEKEDLFKGGEFPIEKVEFDNLPENVQQKVFTRGKKTAQLNAVDVLDNFYAIKVNRDDFLKYKLVNGEKASNLDSPTVTFLSTLEAEMKVNAGMEFEKTIGTVEGYQKGSEMYLIMFNADRLNKKDFENLGGFTMRELVDSNIKRRVSVQNIISNWTDYEMRKDIGFYEKSDEVKPKMVRKF